MAEFFTIQAPTEGLYKEKGSKFIAYTYPVRNEEDIKQHLEEVKKLHPKARHVCYAWRLGASGDIYKAVDAGEPSNTAGAPILGQLKSHEVTNALAVVVRYFGGTKLGVGGLIQAYKEAAHDALQKAERVQDFEKAEIEIETSYPALNELQNFIKQNDVIIIEQRFEENCYFRIAVAVEEKEETLQRIKELNILSLNE